MLVIDHAEGLLIDLDDTLTDSKGTRAEAFAAIDDLATTRFGTKPGALTELVDEVLAELWASSPFVPDFIRLGCVATDALWVDFNGPGALLAEVRGWMPGFRSGFWDTVCRRARAESPAARSALGEAFIAERRARIRLFPGVAAALAQLRARVPLALVTNGASDAQRLKLATTGIESYFDQVIISAEVGIAKPRQEIFALACERIGSSPGRTVMVGDSWTNDVMGARNAGLLGIWVRTAARSEPSSSHQLLDDRTAAIDQFSDLPTFLWTGNR
jgi:HAD superfamily hydrolase (TIGR01509 family)